jgi:hypothetical protein
MPQPDNEPSSAAFAYGWVARMMTVVLEMALPGLGGQWLDSKLGTGYWVIVGFAAGFVLGLFHLLQMVKQHSTNNSNPDDQSPPAKTS